MGGMTKAPFVEQLGTYPKHKMAQFCDNAIVLNSGWIFTGSIYILTFALLFRD